MITFNNVSLSYENLEILKNFTIGFEENKITCLLGPSGVGKTTIANILAQLVTPDTGDIEGISDKTLSYIFQEPRLLDWYNVYDNIDFVLKDLYPADERRNIIREYLSMVDLTQYMDYRPSQLSGGMAQRVSIARAFAYPSNLLVMDEPFKGLDIKLKHELISSFQRLWLKSKRTVLFITHDIDEAVSLAHTIYVIKNRPVEIVKSYSDVQEGNQSFMKESLKKIYF